MKAMILAAGLGTRLKPFTDFHPKALATVNGKPMLQRNIEYLQRSGVYDVVINVHHFAEQIVDALAQNQGWGSRYTISDETGEVLETGGGLKKAAPLFVGEENLVMINADILTDLDLPAMIQQHLHSKAAATLAVRHRNSSRYLLMAEGLKLCGWENVKTGEKMGQCPDLETRPFAFSGLHVMNQCIFQNLPFEGKFSIIDVYLKLCNQLPIFGFDHSGGKFADIGTPEKLLEAASLFE